MSKMREAFEADMALLMEAWMGRVESPTELRALVCMIAGTGDAMFEEMISEAPDDAVEACNAGRHMFKLLFQGKEATATTFIEEAARAAGHEL